MTELAAASRSVVVEREMPHPPEKIWRALTESALMEEWLMKNDFRPVVGQRFNFRAEPGPQWNGVTDCEVLVVEPHARLAYSWNASGDEAATGIRTVVTWTLTPTNGGTHVRVEQSGFRPEHDRFYKGASYGWQRFVGELERVVAGLT
ncbi:MAG TPA: SRPBCC domain-containing protein [Longimicrobiales bacterium]|nr:SRPBCC domain-containing protein [Longimicrobiales bacterium]